MPTAIEYTNEFEQWYLNLTEVQQDNVAAVVGLLEARGTSLGFPYSSRINASKNAKMRELRIQSQGNPIRVFYCFDPRRSVILLVGGDKTGDDRFYQKMIPIAERLYDIYLKEIEQEGLI